MNSGNTELRGRQARDQWQVALVSMPFVSHMRPSIQLGLLKSIAVSHGFAVDTFHLNLDFAQQIGPAFYEVISEYGRCFVGDWLFSGAAFGGEAPDPGVEFLEHFRGPIEELLAETKQTRESLLKVRAVEVPRFIDRLMETIDWGRYQVVGFTSTFQQNLASFALAARIKSRFPDMRILFGGANFEGEMGVELVRSIPCIDYAVIGEGDQAFPDVLIALQEGRDPAEVPGVACRREGKVSVPRSRPPFENLNALPAPDYEEFFARAESLDLLPPGPRREVQIPFESARGCWWGAKHHCTFCGLNGKSMAFRAKSPAKVQRELRECAERYRSFRFDAVDNILDMSYLKSFFVELIASGADYQFFYEVKSNLTREQLKLLGHGGVKRIQPGIESLNTHVLKLMRKGVTGIQNVNMLKWSRYYGIAVSWNILYGFPGERVEDYRQQDGLLRHLVHLDPPGSIGRIWMERFSPIFFDRAAFPASYVRPHASYRYLYPEGVKLEEIAYFFEYQFEDSLPDAEFAATRGQVKAWQAAWKEPSKPRLTFWSAPGFLQIEDVRNPSQPGTYTFTGALALLYTAFSDAPDTAARVKEARKLPWEVEEIEEALDEFCARGLMMREGRQFLSLALPATPGR